MFSRKSSQPESVQPVPSSEETPSASRKKGRPTPRRSQAASAHSRPLIPADRKAAKAEARRKRDEAYRREQEALITGDERHLPLRDKGRVRRFVRDWVDARWSFAEFVLPVMLLFLIGMFALSLVRIDTTITQYLVLGLTVVMYGLFGLSVIEGIWVWQRLKKKIAELLPGEEIPRGTWYYCYGRMIMARRWRSPRPQNKRGEYPKGRPSRNR